MVPSAKKADIGYKFKLQITPVAHVDTLIYSSQVQFYITFVGCCFAHVAKKERCFQQDYCVCIRKKIEDMPNSHVPTLEPN